LRLAPEITELAFWYGATLLDVNQESEAMLVLRELFKKEPFWFEVLKRLVAAQVLRDDPALLKRVETLPKQ
jgi:hypothetical protein